MKNKQHKIAFIGIGLIGSSMARDLKTLNPECIIIGADQSLQHLEIALQEKIIDVRMSVKEACLVADTIIISIPVDEIPGLVTFCLDHCKENALVMDCGSTKGNICRLVSAHPRRKNFVAAHPVAGTENAGPLSGKRNLFRNKVMFVCEREKVLPGVLVRAEQLIRELGMRIEFADPEIHDQQMAALSHLSHVLSYTLAHAAMKMENAEVIEKIAGSGFASMVRLAQSKASMWTPIFLENKQALFDAVQVMENELTQFKLKLMESNSHGLSAYICEANTIGEMIRKREEKMLILN